MSEILVTGASGFIGQHLVQSLVQAGQTVTCLVRTKSRVQQLQALGARLVHGDVTDFGSLRAAATGQDVVFHLAGLVRAFAARHMYRVNVEGSRNIARACAMQPTPPVLVVVSTLAAAGPTDDERPLTESDPPRPVSHYGRSKLRGEQAAAVYAGDVPITIVRPPIVLGEGDDTHFPMFKMPAHLGLSLIPLLRCPKCSIIHAADLVRLLVLAAERGMRCDPVGDDSSPDEHLVGPRGLYYAACERDFGLDELGRMIGEAFGRRRVRCIRLPRPLVWMTAGGAEIIGRVRRRPTRINFDSAREMLAGSWLCSPLAATEQLGFRVAAPITDRIGQTAEWYRREDWL